jgi:hypothetical protein
LASTRIIRRASLGGRQLRNRLFSTDEVYKRRPSFCPRSWLRRRVVRLPSGAEQSQTPQLADHGVTRDAHHGGDGAGACTVTPQLRQPLDPFRIPWRHVDDSEAHGHHLRCTDRDLLQVDGRDLRQEPLEARKRALVKLLRGARSSLVINTYYEADGAIVFREACRLGCEGIVSKRLGSPYRSGRTAHWIKVKNPKAPAVKREAEEEWR